MRLTTTARLLGGLATGLALTGMASPAVAQTALRGTDGESPVSRSARGAIITRARRVAGETPGIDGRLDEAAWAQAVPVSDFVQMRPDPGARASVATEARVLFDDGAIYIGMRLFDDPDSVAAQLTRRDASGTFTDWAHVLIDSYHDRRTAFRFSITPRGAKKDVLHFNDVQEDLNWDAVWDAAAAIDSDGWTAEFRIPFSQLRFDRGDGEALVWGINFGREVARRGEWSWWSPVLPSVGGIVSQAGELRDLSALRPPRRLELIPYTLGRITAAPDDPDNPFYRRRDGSTSAGADLRLGIGSNLTLSATINPDFGQVEADPSVVNLSAFETFFPDRRPFFTEGSNIFAFRIGTDDNSGESLFYTRRIGRAPQRFVRPAGGWVDAPDATTILAAAKLSGRTGSGWTIGILDAVTAEEEARLARPGETWVEPVEPRTNYAVVALSKDFREGRSSIGFLGTSVNRHVPDESFDFLRSSAYALGMTGRHRFANDTWEAAGYAAASHIRGSEESILLVQRGSAHYYQRPDADHIELDPARTSLTGGITHFYLNRIGGDDPWRGGFGAHVRTPGFEVNDIGFQQEADQVLVFGNVRFHQFEPKGIFRSFNIGLNPSAGWTFGAERMWTQVGSFGNFELTNFWSGNFWIARRLEAVSPGAMRGGPAVLRPAGWQYDFQLQSDRRKRVTVSLNSHGGAESGTGAWTASISPTVSLRPSTQLNVALGTGIGRSHNTWQYVGQPVAEGSPRYLVGELNQTTVSLTTRINYTISPTLSFELYAQPFVSGGDYTSFRTLGDTRARDFDRRFTRLAGDALAYDEEARLYGADTDGNGTLETRFANPDFSFRQMRGNAVLRWEYRPGSTLYLVWGQSRTAYMQGEPGDAFDLGRDADRLFNGDPAFPTPVTNVLLIKLSYWINP